MHLWLYSQTWGHVTSKSQVLRFAFYPRPPGGGRHPTWPYPENLFHISIHALRVEGDPALFRLPISFPNFYPRPPGGGGRPSPAGLNTSRLFLSTPSGWRATLCYSFRALKGTISIHALRVEGDHKILYLTRGIRISIHALRVEGDLKVSNTIGSAPSISIHALRVEGDMKVLTTWYCMSSFLSTPSGWRATRSILSGSKVNVFLSTPSGWRATCFL